MENGKEDREVFCISDGVSKWHAVLGNYEPPTPDMDPENLTRIKPCVTQRLCDQQIMAYKHILSATPSCEACCRILALMVEFARPEEKSEDDRDESHADVSIAAHASAQAI